MKERRVSPQIRIAVAGLCLGVIVSYSVSAEEKAGGGGDLRSAAQNPISSLISLPFKFTVDQGANNGDAQILNINPVVPVTVGDWNLVNRALIPIANVDGAIQGPNNPSPGPGNGASGLGDINYSLYFSPVKYDKVIWGVGPSINLPTASDDQLGSGKWSAGVTGVALAQPGWGHCGWPRSAALVLCRGLRQEERKPDPDRALPELQPGQWLVSDHRFGHNHQLAGGLGQSLDRPTGRWCGEAVQGRRAANQCQIGGVLQRRTPRWGTGVEYYFPVGVPVSQVITTSQWEIDP